MPSNEAKAAAIASMPEDGFGAIDATDDPAPAAKPVPKAKAKPRPKVVEIAAPASEAEPETPLPAEEEAADEAPAEKPSLEEDPDAEIALPEDDDEPAVEEKTEDEKKKELAAERIARAVKRDERARAFERDAKADRSAAAEERAAASRDREQLSAIAKMAREDPIALLEKLGVTYEKHTRWALNNGKRGPEDMAGETRSELEALKQQIAERDAALERQQFQAAYQRELSEAVTHVEGSAEKYPTLYGEHTPQQIQAKFEEVWGRVRATNATRPRHLQETFSHEQVAEWLEQQAKEEYEIKHARRLRVAGPGRTESNHVSAIGKPAGKAITSDLANGTSGRNLTKEERRQLAIDQLRGLR